MVRGLRLVVPPVGAGGGVCFRFSVFLGVIIYVQIIHSICGFNYQLIIYLPSTVVRKSVYMQKAIISALVEYAQMRLLSL